MVREYSDPDTKDAVPSTVRVAVPISPSAKAGVMVARMTARAERTSFFIAISFANGGGIELFI